MFLCPHCRRELPPILPEFAGQTISCPHCGGAMQAPEPVAPPVAVRAHPVDEAASRVASVWSGGVGGKVKVAMLAATILWVVSIFACAGLYGWSASGEYRGGMYRIRNVHGYETDIYPSENSDRVVTAAVAGAVLPTCPYVLTMIVLGVAYFAFKK